jgi:hypothetical protein
MSFASLQQHNLFHTLDLGKPMTASMLCPNLNGVGVYKAMRCKYLCNIHLRHRIAFFVINSR